jgi:vacuolar iron transporter family protein
LCVCAFIPLSEFRSGKWAGPVSRKNTRKTLLSRFTGLPMSQIAHFESHFTASKVVRDIVIGVSDGLTVPFALAAGLSGAVAASHIVVTAGLAEIAAGSIAMGLGGYLAAKSDAEHYDREQAREHMEVRDMADKEEAEVREIFMAYGLTDAETTPIIDAFRQRPGEWVDFMMRFELGLEKPEPKRVLTSALTIGGSYILGGLIPLGPYIFISSIRTGLLVSMLLTGLALAGFGYIKARFTGLAPLRSAIQTLVIGGLAAAAAFAIARIIS